MLSAETFALYKIKKIRCLLIKEFHTINFINDFVNKCRPCRLVKSTCPNNLI